MKVKCALVLVVFSFLELSCCEGQATGSGCGECDQSSCHPPVACLAGMVKDSCDCCYLCGRKEGQHCDHPRLSSGSTLGKCGENLECRIRTDLDLGDTPEATCYCKQTYPLCGSDGVTYDNICQLTEERYRRRDGLRSVSREPCTIAPTIVSFPQNQRNSTGSYVAMLCEAKGWPSPTIKWTAHKPNQEAITLPGTTSRIVVHSRSGSGHGDVTSWLLISHLSVEDNATYRCVAENDLGWTSASAHVHVLP